MGRARRGAAREGRPARDPHARKNPIPRNEGFTCAFCALEVPPAPGSRARNHCPRCLRSLHVDGDVPGDRSSDCGGLMDPVDLEFGAGEWRVRQRCRRCGIERRNRLYPDWRVAADVVPGTLAELEASLARRTRER